MCCFGCVHYGFVVNLYWNCEDQISQWCLHRPLFECEQNIENASSFITLIIVKYIKLARLHFTKPQFILSSIIILLLKSNVLRVFEVKKSRESRQF